MIFIIISSYPPPLSTQLAWSCHLTYQVDKSGESPQSALHECDNKYLRSTHVIVSHDGLVQERRNSSALAVELCLSCTNRLMG